MCNRFTMLAVLLLGLFIIERVDTALSLPGVAIAAVLTAAGPAGPVVAYTPVR